MPRGKANGLWSFKIKWCTYEDKSRCKLPKYKRCEHCIRLKDGSKLCKITSPEMIADTIVGKGELK